MGGLVQSNNKELIVKTLIMRLACCALVMAAGAGCDPSKIFGGGGSAGGSGSEEGYSSVNVENCTKPDINFPDGEQFAVHAKLSTDPDFTLYGQLWGGPSCPASSLNIKLDQPGQWQVRAIGILGEEIGTCHSNDGTGEGCSDVRDSLYQQYSNGPTATMTLY